MSLLLSLVLLAAVPAEAPAAAPSVAEQKPGTWVRRLAARPMEDVGLLPRLSYESSMAYDRRNRRVVMWGGHGLQCDSPQLDETWLYDPAANSWKPGASPRRPMGSCCVRDSTYDEVAGRVVQFEGHHGDHGWEFRRQKGAGLRASAPWLYDAAADRWLPCRPAFGPATRPYKALAYSPDHFITLLFSGEGQENDTWAYDSYANAWFDLNPPAKPPRFTGAGMCYDRRRRVFVMLDQATPRVGETPNPRGLWTFDPAAGAWKEYRPEHSPAANPNSVAVYDEAAGQAVCFAAEGSTETGKWKMRVWALDLDKPDWTEVTPEGPGPAYYNHGAAYVPDLNIHVVGPGHTNWDTGHPTVRETWTYRYKAGQAPGGLEAGAWSLSVNKDSVSILRVVPEPLPPGMTEVPKAALYRAEGELPWKLIWTEITPELPRIFTDKKVERGKVYWYRTKDGDWLSAPRRAQPTVPGCPLVAPKGEKEVEVSWAKSPAEMDVAGYNVYRARVKIKSASGGNLDRLAGPETFVKLNAEPLAEPRFADKTVDLAGPDQSGYKFALWAYHVRAVNLLGVESGPSPYALTIPDQLGAPEVAQALPGKVTLKWEPHPSEAVVGYNVYRITNTYEKPKRLNPEPVKATEFTDASLAGEAMRRYCVLAVDCLGQEGISSPEVWAFRKPTAHPLPD